jgi:hypothetical protein
VGGLHRPSLTTGVRAAACLVTEHHLQRPVLVVVPIMQTLLCAAAQVEAAARVANAHDFISALPEAYGTKVCWGLPQQVVVTLLTITARTGRVPRHIY